MLESTGVDCGSLINHSPMSAFFETMQLDGTGSICLNVKKIHAYKYQVYTDLKTAEDC